jgi:hypothetical protein
MVGRLFITEGSGTGSTTEGADFTMTCRLSDVILSPVIAMRYGFRN